MCVSSIVAPCLQQTHPVNSILLCRLLWVILPFEIGRKLACLPVLQRSTGEAGDERGLGGVGVRSGGMCRPHTCSTVHVCAPSGLTTVSPDLVNPLVMVNYRVTHTHARVQPNQSHSTKRSCINIPYLRTLRQLNHRTLNGTLNLLPHTQVGRF